MIKQTNRVNFLILIGLTILGCLVSPRLVFANNFIFTSKIADKKIPNEQYYDGMGCSGKNTSPALSWKNAPKNTKSFAITVFDPDVPIETGWTHWIIFNIPANVNSLKAGAGNVALKNYPQGSIQSVTSFDSQGYGGPCPLKNSSHKVIYTLYALDVNKLKAYNHLIIATSTPAQVGIALYKHSIAKTSFIAYSSG